MTSFVRKLSAGLGVLATLATVAMMVAIVADVTYRGIAGKSVPGLIEFSETALVAAVFLGLAYTGSTNGHIAVDLVTERLPANVRRWVVAAGWIVALVFLVWTILGTYLRALESQATNESRMGLVNWPLWPARWIIVFGLVVMALVAVVNIIRLVMGNEVMGHQTFDTVAVDTTTFAIAESERATMSGLRAANEAVISDGEEHP